LKELFKMIDTDNSGTITYDELKNGLKRVGSDLMEPEIQALMDAVSANIMLSTAQTIISTAAVCDSTSHIDILSSFFSIFQADIDNSGTIDYGEFLAATLHMNKLDKE
jgi:calcium-dependent protein kinase